MRLRFFTKYGGVWTAYPQGALTVRVKRRELVSQYAFGTRTAHFHVCRLCDVVPVATSEIEGRVFAVVNVNAFSNVPAAMLISAPGSHKRAGVRSRNATF